MHFLRVATACCSSFRRRQIGADGGRKRFSSVRQELYLCRRHRCLHRRAALALTVKLRARCCVTPSTLYKALVAFRERCVHPKGRNAPLASTPGDPRVRPALRHPLPPTAPADFDIWSGVARSYNHLSRSKSFHDDGRRLTLIPTGVADVHISAHTNSIRFPCFRAGEAL